MVPLSLYICLLKTLSYNLVCISFLLLFLNGNNFLSFSYFDDQAPFENQNSPELNYYSECEISFLASNSSSDNHILYPP